MKQIMTVSLSLPYFHLINVYVIFICKEKEFNLLETTENSITLNYIFFYICFEFLKNNFSGVNRTISLVSFFKKLTIDMEHNKENII